MLTIVDRAKPLFNAIQRIFGNLIENLARRLEREARGVAAFFPSSTSSTSTCPGTPPLADLHQSRALRFPVDLYHMVT